MFKLFGVLFGAGMAVTAGSYLIIPFMILSILFTITEGISRWWPFLLGLLVGALVLALVISHVRDIGSKVVLLVLFGLGSPLAVFLVLGASWTSASIAAFVGVTLIGTGLIALENSALERLGVGRKGSVPHEMKETVSALRAAGNAGSLTLVQNIWIAPTAVMFLTFPNPWTLIGALLGMIATFFAYDAVEDT